MIYDKLSNCKTYFGCAERLKAAFDFIEKTDFFALKTGVTEIDGKNLYVNFVKNVTGTDEDGLFEAHNDYIDVQFIVDGEERMDCAARDACTSAVPYDKDGDAELLKTDRFTSVNIEAGSFAVFFPWDAHRPGLSVKKPTDVIKAIIKVKL